MIPAELTGGWVRNGIAIDGADPIETTVVWWLQAPSKHCDLRVPQVGTEGVMSFAGTTTWDDPVLTWHPEIELDPSIFEDIGVISWDGEDMMETGSFAEGGRDVSYVERWQRLPGSEGEQWALSCANGRLVRTGSYALTIVDARPEGGGFAAVAWTLGGGTDGIAGWAPHHSWPAQATLPPPPITIADGETSVLLADGILWNIDEHRKAAGISG
ncbi:hypothetical protein SAMN05892883_4020 [Jatrophihabitans sp. GAS493]|uniref:hypothetical protein n=1 Tax=Jatrophihabitans sp. GAS493 TaxID=1907575 RepID=UPI000BB6F1A2|nr:hypothetical protein [Jatrophihabitans sp. GAS493]SOD74827.1 hypothetical protein SAMN05892883_4020 [Jatrophihabitans sp. GAS493]